MEVADWKTLDGRERGKLLRDAIYKAYEDAQGAKRSQRIGAGWIGKECSREIFYKFRWADKVELKSGQILRLLETGQQQEGRLLQDLRRVGAAIVDRNPNDSRQQISCSSHNGHHFGFLDGIGQNIPFALFEWNVVECKSHNQKNFDKLVKEGVERAKPDHYGQMMTYLREHKLSEGLYHAVNKNTDELHCEFVSFDPRYGERLARKAGLIIESHEPPAKLHNDPSFFKCRFCAASDVCHHGKLPSRNCRTCLNSEVADEGRWRCALQGRFLSIEEQLAGCKSHRYLPSLVAGEQIDADEVGVTYRMHKDSSYWVDGGSGAQSE